MFRFFSDPQAYSLKTVSLLLFFPTVRVETNCGSSYRPRRYGGVGLASFGCAWLGRGRHEKYRNIYLPPSPRPRLGSRYSDAPFSFCEALLCMRLRQYNLPLDGNKTTQINQTVSPPWPTWLPISNLSKSNNIELGSCFSSPSRRETPSSHTTLRVKHRDPLMLIIMSKRSVCLRPEYHLYLFSTPPK